MTVAYLGYKVNSSEVALAEKRLDKMSGAAGVAAKAAGALTIAFGAMFAGGAVIREISTFDTAMSGVAAVTRATAKDLEAMRQVAMDLGSSTEFSASQAADGLRFLGMAGFEASEAMAAIPAVLDLATAASMDLASAADISSNIMSGFGIEAAKAADVADVLAAASSRSNTNVAQLGSAMATVAPIAAALSIGLEDTAAAIGVMSDAGIQGERAGTAMRGVLASLAGPTKEATDALKAYGITVADVNPETNSLADIVALLGERGLTTADAMKIFGREAASGALVLVDGASRLRDFGTELRNVDGAAADMAGTMRDNLGGDIKGLQSAVSGLILSLGDAGLTAVLRGVVSGITALVRGVASFIDGISSMSSAVTGWFAATTNMQVATDNVVLAMGDEIEQAKVLFALMGEGNTMSQHAALAKLSEAEGHLRAADAKRQEADATAALALSQLQLNYERQMEALNAIRQGTDAYHEQEESVVAILEQMQSWRDIIGDANTDLEAAKSEVDRIRQAIANAEDGMVTFGGETFNAKDLTDRLALAADGVNFDKGISSAQSLANWLGIALSSALQLSAITPAMADEDLAMSGSVIPDAAQRETNRAAVERMKAALIRTSGSGTSGASAGGNGGVSELERLRMQLDDAYSSSVKMAEATTVLNGGLAAGKITQEEYNNLLALASKEFAGAENSAESFAKTLREKVTSAAESVADAFGDFVARGFKDFKGFVTSIKDAFLRLLGDLATMAIRNKILIPLGLAGGSGATGGSGILSGALGAFGTGGAAGTGLLGGIGASLSGGLGGILNIGANAAAAGGGFMATLGAAVPVLGIAALAIGLFSKKVTELDRGVRVTLDGLASTIESYKTLKTSSLFGLINSTKTGYTADPDNPIAGVVAGVQNSVLEAARVFGYGADLFDQFSYQFKLSLKDLSEEDALAAIQKELSLMGDGMAALVPNFADMNSLIKSANEAVAETYALGSTRFEAEMLAAARRRGEITVGRASDGVNTPDSLIRLNNVEENTAENNRLMKRLTEAFENWQYGGFRVIAE